MSQQRFRRKYEIASNYQGDDYNDETFRNLMNSARLELPAYAEQALEADDENFYNELSWDIEQSQLLDQSFPESHFSLLLHVIRDARFLRAHNGWTLLMIFESDWEKVTEAQRESLLQTLAWAYEKFEHWMPRFSISELVGENFAPAQAHSFFRRLADSADEKARVFVPHGYEHALRNSADATLTAELWMSLLNLERDESQKVRGEVEESLRRLANHGLHRPKQ